MTMIPLREGCAWGGGWEKSMEAIPRVPASMKARRAPVWMDQMRRVLSPDADRLKHQIPPLDWMCDGSHIVLGQANRIDGAPMPPLVLITVYR